MSMLQSSFFVLDVIGVVTLIIAVSLTSVVAACGDGPVMRRPRGRR
ncbi:hypothetical protein [Caulobacter sp. 1776]